MGEACCFKAVIVLVGVGVGRDVVIGAGRDVVVGAAGTANVVDLVVDFVDDLANGSFIAVEKSDARRSVETLKPVPAVKG